MDKLKFIDLRFSKKLIWTPEFSGCPSLERLYLGYCINLVKIHPSIGKLSRLIVLDLEYCYSLINLPSMSSKMESLEVLNLCGCSKLKEIEFEGILKSLSILYLGETAIKELPSSIECFTKLTILDLRDCQYLKCLPTEFSGSLERLYLGDCINLVEIHPSIGKLRLILLDLGFCCSRIKLPRMSSKMVSLEILYLHDCPKLKEIELEGILRRLSELSLGEYALYYSYFTTHPWKLRESKRSMAFNFSGNVMREICHSLLYRYLSHYSVRNLRIFQLFKLEVYGYDESAQQRSGITLQKKIKKKSGHDESAQLRSGITLPKKRKKKSGRVALHH